MPTIDFKPLFTAPGTALLKYAISKDSKRIFNLAIALNADIYAQDREGNSFLHKARSCDMASMLVSQGLSVNAVNKKGQTSLIIGLHNLAQDTSTQTCALVHFLLRNGADPNLHDAHEIPLHLALSGQRIIPANVLAQLIKYKADINKLNCHGHTPLTCAIQDGLVEHAIVLLEANAQQPANDPKNPPVLQLVCRHWKRLSRERNYEILLATLFKNGVNQNCLNSRMDNFEPLEISKLHSPLHFAAYFCNETALSPFLKLDINSLSAKDHHGRTPLHLAVINGNISATQALLNSGVWVDICDDYGLPPLYYAANNPNCSDILMDMLVTSGADVNQRLPATHANVTLLHAAARQLNGAPAIAKLVQYGANPNAKDGAYEQDRRILSPDEFHIDPYPKNSSRTPLHYAAGIPANVKTLLRNNARVEADNLGLTPEIYARKLECKDSEIILQGAQKVTTWTNSLQLSMNKALEIAANLAKEAAKNTIFSNSPKNTM